jgi:hypothetical protein
VVELDTLYQKKEIIKMQVRVKENTDEVGKCGCGRSPTGKCIGWHGLTEEQFQERLEKYQTGQQDLSGKDI